MNKEADQLTKDITRLFDQLIEAFEAKAVQIVPVHKLMNTENDGTKKQIETLTTIRRLKEMRKKANEESQD